METDTVTYRPPTVNSTVSSTGGTYAWTSDNPGVLSVVGLSSGKDLISVPLKINGTGQATLNLVYTDDNGSSAVDSATFVLSKDIAVVGWIDRSHIDSPDPTGVSPSLVNSLNSAVQCPLTLLAWAASATFRNPADPQYAVTTDADRTYANNFLIRNSANDDPGLEIDSLFGTVRSRYRAFLRFQSAYVVKNGAIIGAPKALIAQTAGGFTLNPCPGPLPPPLESEAHPADGAFGISQSGQSVYLMTQGRIGAEGQAGDTYLNDRNGVIGATTPWIFALVQFDLNGNLLPITHQQFPTYSVYEFGYPAGAGHRIDVVVQEPLQIFINRDSSSFLLKP